MSYSIYKSDGTPITVDDNAIDVAYYNSLGGGPYPGESGSALSGQGMGTQLIGRNTVDYGAVIAALTDIQLVIGSAYATTALLNAV